MSRLFKILLVGIGLFPILSSAQTASEPSPAPKDNFFWTHRKERHWQSWAGGGPLLGLFGTNIKLQYDGYAYAYFNHIYWRRNNQGGYRLAEISLPIGVAAQFNQVYRANRWFGLQAGAEGFALYRSTKWYSFDSVGFQTHIDPNAPNGGPYTYTYTPAPPIGEVHLQQFLWGYAAQLQFLLQVPGGRLGIRQGVRMQNYFSPGVVQENSKTPSHFSYSLLQSIFFSITPRLRAEVQRSWAFVERGVRTPPFRNPETVSTYNAYWLFTLQYSLRR